jgi:hypothetical protein
MSSKKHLHQKNENKFDHTNVDDNNIAELMCKTKKRRWKNEMKMYVISMKSLIGVFYFCKRVYIGFVDEQLFHLKKSI